MNEAIFPQPLLAFACAAIGYLLGNIQTAIIISKSFYHDDVRNHGSGNAGSTNMIRVFGLKPGAITFAGDFLKSVASILVGRFLFGSLGGYIAGFMTVLGHCYPAFVHFRGGKGVASSIGLAFMVNPLGAAFSVAIGAIVFSITKRVSVASLLSILLFFISVLILKGADIALVVTTGFIVILVYIRHIENIRRLIRGEEAKLIPKAKD